MNERKKITEKLTRKDIQEKIRIAMKSKPTQSYLLSMGVKNPNHEEAIKEKIVRNAKNRKRFSLKRPQTIKEYKLDLNSVPAISYSCEEFKTPPWFRNIKKVDVSIIIPLYKSKDVVLDLIKNWKLECDLSYEIIFVDDCCPENSRNAVLSAWSARREELKVCVGKIILNKANGGYGAACNNGASFAQGDYLIFLNADTLVTNKWIEPMIELFKDQKVGLVGNLQLKKGGGLDGTIDSAGSEWRWGDDSFVHIGRHSYHKKQIGTPYTMENSPVDILLTAEREMVTGCCFSIPKALFDYIGGFNPNYRIGYWEDSEICMNVKELGYKIMFTSKSVIYHKLGHTGSGGHKYMNANANYFKNKWVNSGRLHKVLNLPEIPPKINTILIKRTHAHGDALVATGVCAALKKQYPDVKIIFSTIHSDVIENNPYIDEFVEIGKINSEKYDLFYNLDLSYEWRPKVNILKTYAEFCGVKKEDCEIYLPEEPVQGMIENYIVIHAGKTNWAGRDWPSENFYKLSELFRSMGEKVVCVGKYTEDDIPCDVDLRGKISIPQMHWVLKNAKLFVGIDSFPMHVAQVAKTQGIAFFGCVTPELRLFSPNMTGITAKNLSCLGCHHLKQAPSTATTTCITKNLDCIKMVSVEDMFELAKKKLNIVSP